MIPVKIVDVRRKEILADSGVSSISAQVILYDDLGRSFARTLDRSGKGDREDGNQRRRQISLHSFRRFVKTTISDLGYADFSKWFIGHSGSTY